MKKVEQPKEPVDWIVKGDVTQFGKPFCKVNTTTRAVSEAQAKSYVLSRTKSNNGLAQSAQLKWANVEVTRK